MKEFQFSYDKQPIAVFLLGANGSGKSSLRRILNLSDINTNIDPDLLNKAYQNKYPDTYIIEAAKEALVQFNNAITKGLNICMESTLAGHGTMRRIMRAKNAGFYVVAYYAGLDNVELNLERIRHRVSLGGHYIADDVVRKRYNESRENFIKVMQYFDDIYLVDNSGKDFELLLTKIDDVINVNASKEWANTILKQFLHT